MHSINITWIMQYILFIKFEFGLSAYRVHVLSTYVGLTHTVYKLEAFYCTYTKGVHVIRIFIFLNFSQNYRHLLHLCMLSHILIHIWFVCLSSSICSYIKKYAYFEDFNFLKLFMRASSVSYGHRKCTSNKCNYIV